MIKLAFRLLSLSVAAGGWILAALSLHVVRTPDRLQILTKQRLGVADTYADTRGWTMADISKHPILVRRLIECDNADLLKSAADSRSRRDVKTQLEDALQNAPPAPAVITAGPISFTSPF
jgi:hypothetical protein